MKKLRTDADFDNAVYFRSKIEVWQNGELLEDGVCIIDHSPEAVTVSDGCHYLKYYCEFLPQ